MKFQNDFDELKKLKKEIGIPEVYIDYSYHSQAFEIIENSPSNNKNLVLSGSYAVIYGWLLGYRCAINKK